MYIEFDITGLINIVEVGQPMVSPGSETESILFCLMPDDFAADN